VLYESQARAESVDFTNKDLTTRLSREVRVAPLERKPKEEAKAPAAVGAQAEKDKILSQMRETREAKAQAKEQEKKKETEKQKEKEKEPAKEAKPVEKSKVQNETSAEATKEVKKEEPKKAKKEDIKHAKEEEVSSDDEVWCFVFCVLFSLCWCDFHECFFVLSSGLQQGSQVRPCSNSAFDHRDQNLRHCCCCVRK